MTWNRTLYAFVCALILGLLATPATAATRTYAPSRPSPVATPGYDQQRQAAQAELLRNQAEMAAVVQEEAQLDSDIAHTRDDIAQRRLQAAALARMLYVQPSSVIVVLAREPSVAQSVQDFVDLQFVAAHARDETVRIDALEQRLKDLQRRRELASARESALRQAVQVSLTQTADLDIWGRARTWQAANADWKLDPPNPNHSKSPLQSPLVAYTMTQPYGPSIYWFEPSFAGFAHFHTGLDMSAPTGTPAGATDDGVVIATGYDGYGYGNYVVLGHPGGRASLYAHLAQSLVRAGDKVTQGQPVGLVGSTGNSTGPHLHFEVLVQGLPLDPAPLMVAPSS